MKRLILLLCALVMALSLISCQKQESKEEKKVVENSVEDTTENEEKTTDEEAATDEEKTTDDEKATDEEAATGTELEIGKTCSFKDFDFTLKSLSLIKDTDGKVALKYTYDWKNKSDNDTAPFITFNLTGFQDDVEIDTCLYITGVDFEKGQKTIKKDAEISDCEGIVGYIDPSKKVLLELKEIFSLDDAKFTMELDPSTLK